MSSHKGVVKFYTFTKRYGFIEAPDLPDNLFVAEKCVLLPPGEYLEAGDEVTFGIGRDQQGRPRAENVRRVVAASPSMEPLPARAGKPVAHSDTTPYIDVPGRPRRYLRSDMVAESFDDRARHRLAAEAVFARPVRPEVPLRWRAERFSD
jgi:cold shock CspA family protein